jgi:hypothetical protein
MPSDLYRPFTTIFLHTCVHWPLTQFSKNFYKLTNLPMVSYHSFQKSFIFQHRSSLAPGVQHPQLLNTISQKSFFHPCVQHPPPFNMILKKLLYNPSTLDTPVFNTKIFWKSTTHGVQHDSQKSFTDPVLTPSTLQHSFQKNFVEVSSTRCSIQKFFGSHRPMVSYHSFQKTFIFQHTPTKIFRKSTPLCVPTRFSKKLLQTPVFKTLNPSNSMSQKTFRSWQGSHWPMVS